MPGVFPSGDVAPRLEHGSNIIPGRQPFSKAEIT
jgi:hypothetical protein